MSSSFITVLPEKMFNVKFGDGESVQSFVSRLQSDGNLFGQYMAAKMGYRWIL